MFLMGILKIPPPAAGPKGFALPFMIDLMSGLLSGSAIGGAVQALYGNASVPYDCSDLFIAINVAFLGNPTPVRKLADDAAGRVQNCKRVSGADRLYAPVEPEWRNRQAAAGKVSLTPAGARMLVCLAAELGISPAPLEQQGKEVGYAKA